MCPASNLQFDAGALALATLTVSKRRFGLQPNP